MPVWAATTAVSMSSMYRNASISESSASLGLPGERSRLLFSRIWRASVYARRAMLKKSAVAFGRFTVRRVPLGRSMVVTTLIFVPAATRCPVHGEVRAELRGHLQAPVLLRVNVVAFHVRAPIFERCDNGSRAREYPELRMKLAGRPLQSTSACQLVGFTTSGCCSASPSLASKYFRAWSSAEAAIVGHSREVGLLSSARAYLLEDASAVTGAFTGLLCRCHRNLLMRFGVGTEGTGSKTADCCSTFRHEAVLNDSSFADHYCNWISPALCVTNGSGMERSFAQRRR